MERMKDLLSFFIAAMAMVSLICAIYEAMNQRNVTAGTLAGIFLLATLLFYLPRLETLSALGIEVRLRNTLDRAEEIIDRMKTLAEANAKVTYMTVAWGNRLGSPSAIDKQKLLDQTDEQLRALKVDEAVRKTIAKPLIALIGVDLYQTYSQVMDRFVFWTQEKENRKLNANHTPEAQAEYQKVLAEIAVWRRANAGKGPGDNLQNYDLGSYLSRNTPTALLGEPQKAAAEAFRAEILWLYDDCASKGGYTPEAAAFLDRHVGENYQGAADLKVRELFGIEVEFGGAVSP